MECANQISNATSLSKSHLILFLFSNIIQCHLSNHTLHAVCVPVKIMREEAVTVLYQAVPVQQLLIRLVLVPRCSGRHVVTTFRNKAAACCGTKPLC